MKQTEYTNMSKNDSQKSHIENLIDEGLNSSLEYKLKIKCANPRVLEFYNKNNLKFNPGDAGFDIYCPNDIDIRCGTTVFIDLGIQCEMIEKCQLYTETWDTNISYYLYPRSSFSKTPLILGNHVGIIDSGYRGSIGAYVKYVPSLEDIQKIMTGNEPPVYSIKAGTRLFQICHPSLKCFSYEITDNLSESQRGMGGFGSTGL